MAGRDTETRVEMERLLSEDAEDPKPRVHQSPSNLAFKAYVIVTMTILWTGYTLMVRYTRSTTPASEVGHTVFNFSFTSLSDVFFMRSCFPCRSREMCNLYTFSLQRMWIFTTPDENFVNERVHQQAD